MLDSTSTLLKAYLGFIVNKQFEQIYLINRFYFEIRIFNCFNDLTLIDFHLPNAYNMESNQENTQNNEKSATKKICYW